MNVVNILSRVVKITFCIIFIAFLLLTLAVLFVSVYWFIVGESLETFPTPEKIEKARIFYSFISLCIIVIDSFLIVGIIKLIKSIRAK